MIQAFFDANIWIDFCWNRYYAKKRLTRKKANTISITRLNSKKIRIMLSSPLLFEITSHFKDYFVLQEVMKHGYSVFEFSRVRRDYSLSKTDRNKVDNYYKDVTSYPVTKGQIILQWLDDQVLDKTLQLAAKYDMGFVDCLHFIAAHTAKCDVFVTKDEALSNSINKIRQRYPSFRRMVVMKPSEFASKYKSVFKK